jgi:hypothetical protein
MLIHFATGGTKMGELLGALVNALFFIWINSLIVRKIFGTKIKHELLCPFSAAIYIVLLGIFILVFHFTSIWTYLIAAVIICLAEFIIHRVRHAKHETLVEFVPVSTDKCSVCRKMKPVNEKGVCEECFRIVYK